MPAYPYGWITAASLFFLLAAVIGCASPIVISGHVRRLGNNDDAELTVRALFGLIRYRYQIPIVIFKGTSVELKEEVAMSGAGVNTWKQYQEDIDANQVMSAIERMKQLLHLTRNLTGWARRTMSRVSVLEWHWTTTVGTGDAMWTALATGAAWSVQSSLLGLISQLMKLRAEPSMQVQAAYQGVLFRSELKCMLQIRLGTALLAGIKLIFRIRKTKEGYDAWHRLLFKT